MKVAVLGGAGLIGNAIVRALLDGGHAVTAIGRRQAMPANLAGLDLTYCAADTATEDGIEASVAGHDAVVDAAAPYPMYLIDYDEGSRRDRLGQAARRTDWLLAALRRHDASLLYIGTAMSDNTGSAKTPLDLPRYLARTVHPYFAVKRLIEDRIAAATANGQRCVVLRPGACVGPWDSKPREQCWVPALIRGRIAVTVQHDVNVVDTRDVARVAVHALEQDDVADSVRVGGVDTTVRALFEAFCSAARVSPPRWSMPAAFGVLPGLWSELALAAVGVKSPLPALIPLLICEQQRLSPGRATLPGGVRPRPLRETVADTLDWYRRLGYC